MTRAKKEIDVEKYFEDYNRTIKKVSVRIDENTVKQFNLTDDNIVIHRFIYKDAESMHTHNFIEMCYVEEGAVEHTVNGQKVRLERGQMVVFLPGTIHEFTPVPEVIMSNIIFSPNILKNATIMDGNAMEMLSLVARSASGEYNINKLQFSGLNMVDIEHIVSKMTEEFGMKRKGYRDVLRSYLDILLVHIIRELREADHILSGSSNNFDKVMPRVLAFIEENYDRKLSLGEVAKISFYNPRYFCALFRESVGKTLTEYLSEVRIQKALELLVNTDMAVDDIGYRVGFSDKKVFYKLFKKTTGTTPAQFRKKEQGKESTCI